MGVLRDECFEFGGTAHETALLGAQVADVGVHPRDLCLEAFNLLGLRLDGVLLEVRVGLSVEMSGAESLLEEADDGTGTLQISLVDVLGGWHRLPVVEAWRKERVYNQKKWRVGVAQMAFLLALTWVMNRHCQQLYS